MRNRILALTAVMGLVASAAFAQTPTKVGGELVVGQYPGGYPHEIAVDVDANGGFVVAWYKSSPAGVKARRFSSTRAGGSELSVNTYGASSDAVDVAMADNGNFVVVWDGSDPYGGSATNAKVFNSGGSPIVGPLALGYSSPSAAAVSVNKSNGDFVVAWTQGSYPSYYGSVQKFNAAGNPIGSTYSFGYSPVDVDVAMDRSGNFVVTWLENYSYGPVAKREKTASVERATPNVTASSFGFGPFGSSFNSGGTPVASNFAVNSGGYGYGFDPSISALGTGRFVVAWSENGGVCDYDVKARIFGTSGSMVSGEILVDQAGGDQSQPDVAGNGTSFVVTWYSYLGCPGKVLPGPDQDGSASGIVGRAFSSTGGPQSVEFIVNSTTAGFQRSPAIGMNNSGDFVVGWANDGAYPSLVNAQIFGRVQPPPEPCGTGVATNLSPSSGSTQTPPVTFRWTAVPDASFYEVYYTVDGGAPQYAGITRDTSLIEPSIPPGTISWYVVTQFGTSCRSTKSVATSFTVDAPPPPPPPPPPDCGDITTAPLPSLVAEATTGEAYTLTWSSITDADTYEYQESTNELFAGATTITKVDRFARFQHTASDTPVPYFYRVRAVKECPAEVTKTGPYSKTIRVVILPKPAPSSTNPQIVTEFGNTGGVDTFLFIPGFGSSDKVTPHAASYTVVSSEEWLVPSPASGELPPGGTTVLLTATITDLLVGSTSATLTITRDDGLGAGRAPMGTSVSAVPVSVSLVAPVTPLGKQSTPPANALIIPAVANVGGLTARWLSDVKVNNSSNQSIQYQITFTATEQDGTIEGKKTAYTLRPGQTVAMDDIVRQWFGFGDLAGGTNGTLGVRPLNFTGREAAGVSLATIATSRTYTRYRNSLASFGQFMPSVPFANFISTALPGARLSMQQISQTASMRSNFGLVEGSGKSVQVLLTMFDRLGTKLGEFPVSLRAAEHKQLNSLLALNNITVIDGRIEATVTGGDGSITAYASIVSSGTGDPTLIPGIDPKSISASKYVLAGLADLTNSSSNWRSDVRIFNGGAVAETAQLYFYPQGTTTPVGPFSITIGPGEVKVLEGVVSSQFGLTNTGGAMHVVTAQNSSLIITGETYDDSTTGKFGQTVPSVTPEEAVGTADRALQVLQIEDSAQYRTNIGLAEVTGKPVSVQVQLIVPGSLSAPSTTVQLGANEFRQLNGIVRTLVGKDVYNGRISVKATSGEGKILAYGSVVDNKTLDATYVPGQ